MGHDRLKESQDMSEDSRVLPSSAKQEPAENKPISPLPMGKKKEFWARSASWFSLDESAGCPAVLHPWEVGASSEHCLHIFLLVRRWLKYSYLH